MSAIEEIEIQRASDTERKCIICAIETADLEFLRIGGADIGIVTERVTNGIVLHLSRTKIYRRAAGIRIEVKRARRGSVIAARVVIDPAGLGFIDPGVQLLEKTVTRVGADLVIRFTASEVPK